VREFVAQMAADIAQVEGLDRAEAQRMEQDDPDHQLRETQCVGPLASFRPDRQQMSFPLRLENTAKVVDQTKKFG
jgi:hypothetical protein